MSLTVNIYYTGKNGNARRFAEEMIASGLVEQVRGEPGNERYAYFFPMDDPETVRNKYQLKMRVERFTDAPAKSE